jgi:hypothetical protein
MKHLITILFALILGTQFAVAQATGNIDSFKTSILPKYSMYFSQAELTEYGQLKLTAVDAYKQLKPDEKKSVVSNIAGSWRDSVVLIGYGTQTELWGWSAANGNTWLLDEWDKAAGQPAASAALKPAKTVMHPWFFYLGYQLMGDSQQNLNLALDTRIGFYLLLNRWDFAATYTLGMTGNIDADPTAYSNLGLMSRVHFPIKNSGFSPNIGGELVMASFGSTTSTVKPALVLGFSWFVGIGRIDIGVRIGDATSGMGGYTMYPGMARMK